MLDTRCVEACNQAVREKTGSKEGSARDQVCRHCGAWEMDPQGCLNTLTTMTISLAQLPVSAGKVSIGRRNVPRNRTISGAEMVPNHSEKPSGGSKS